jgi:imidazolonepropionase
MRCDRVWFNAKLVTLAPGRAGLGVVENGMIACREGMIVFAGAKNRAPRDMRAADATDCEGRVITPGFIDCHTHLVHGGNRANEFQMRLAGASYESISKEGGGIVSTMNATRAASEADLVDAALPRLDAMLAEGVTTIEIKSGYGLSLQHEAKQLRAARKLARRRKITISTTFLGAHALPPEFASQADDYISYVCEVMIPSIAKDKLANAVDVFCEGIGFSPKQTQQVFEAAAAHGLRVKLHAEQLSNQHGGALAARFNALSADHLEYLDEPGVAAMAEAGTVAVLLPGAFYFMRETRQPPIDLLRKHGVTMALATDCNPGTSPLTSLLLTMNMAATLFRMTVDECLIGVTRSAAHALGMQDRIGSLEAGKQCDLAIWDVETPAELVYHIGLKPLFKRVWKGQ